MRWIQAVWSGAVATIASTSSSGQTRPPEALWVFSTETILHDGAVIVRADRIAAASWDSVIFDLPGRESLQRVRTLEPLRGTKEHVGDLFDWALALAQRTHEWHDSPPLAWDAEVSRFFATLKRFDDYLAVEQGAAGTTSEASSVAAASAVVSSSPRSPGVSEVAGPG